MKSVLRNIAAALFFIIASFISCQLAAQEFSQQAGDTRAKYTLSGTVTNSVTGAPVSRALVQIAVGSQSTLTDSQGHFEFKDLPEAEASISARKPGFFNEQELNEGQQFSPGMAHIGPDAPAVALKLMPENVIFGRLTADGEPAEAVPIKLISSHIKEGRKRWDQAGYTTTDEEGEFRISNLRPGTYYVVAGPSFGRVVASADAKGYAEVFYPGAVDIASAAPLELTAGQQIETDFAVKRERVFKVSGKITGTASIKGVNLQFIDRAGNAGSFGYRYDSVSGAFATMVIPGTYTLRVQAFDNGQVEVAEYPLTVSSDVADISLALAPPIAIPLLIDTELSNTEVSTRRNRSTGSAGLPINLHLVSVSTHLMARDYWPSSGGTGKERTFFFENIQPGKYAMEITPNGSFYVQSARCGETDLLRDDLTVASDLRPPPMEIVLRDDGATVNVSLQDAQPKGTVLVIPDGQPRQVKTLTTSGESQIGGLAPGDYTVIALDSTKNLEYTNPEALTPFMAGATHITLAPKQTSSITVQLMHVGK
ncbi:MAG TPA: carboxypeptidase regulatory-like domain-containing protein [Terriglobales bacterium]|nr:carboxypeptidase regulatory-like domain-containing protein [Terriglobales bacterium]